ncbi:MAG: aquaporin [Candidatus Saccharimonas sp.]|nr:aquaporin [Candidatus Saccharimonas sp.]
MATTKAASTKRATAKKPAAAKTTVRTVRAADKPAAYSVSASSKRKVSSLPDNIVNIVFAELLGTFVLTLVALLAFKETAALYVGLTLSLLVVAVGATSGAHVNPAVTFGLWAMRKLKLVLVPFYWAAQFLGALLALVVTNWMTSGATLANFSLFDHVSQMNWALFGVELVGMAVFMFGLAAAVSRVDLSAGTRALGVGFSLMVGLLVSGSLLANVQASVDTSKITDVKDVPHVLRVKGAALNPAVAVAATESTDSSFTGTRGNSTEKLYSRFGLEVVLGTLVGAALGGNLYLLVAGRRN